MAKGYPRRGDTRLVLALATVIAVSSLAPASPAHARRDLWFGATNDFTITDNAGCGGTCHGVNVDSSVVGVDNVTISATATSATLAPRAPSGVSAIWRHEGQGASAGVLTGSTTVTVPSGAGRELRYCIGAHVGPAVGGPSDVHQTRCGMVTISREAPVNDPPSVTVAGGNSRTLEIDESTVLALTIVDENPATVTINAVSADASVANLAGETTPNVTVTGVGAGTTTVNITVTDQGGKTGFASVDVTVNPAPVQRPTVTVTSGTSLTLEEGESRRIAFTVADDKPGVSVETSVVAGGGVTLSDSTVDGVTVTAGDEESDATIEIVATDSDGLTGSERVQVRVVDDDGGGGGGNASPAITAIDPAAPLELEANGAARTVTLTVEDDDPIDELGFTASGGPAGLDFRYLGGGRFELVPGAAGEGDVRFTVRDDDGESSSSEPYRVIVRGGPEYSAPRLDGLDPGGPLALEVGGSATLTARVTVGSEGEASVSAASADPGVVAVSPEGERAFRLEARGAGRTTVTVRVADSRGEADSASVEVSVAAANAPPVAADDRFVYDPASPVLDVTANDSDPEGGALEIVLLSGTSERGATLVAESAGVRYTPSGPLAGDDRFDYRVRDPAGQESAAATVTVVASDQDGDGVSDADDNCPISPNPGQEDADSDGLGDVCDPTGPVSPDLARGLELVATVCRSCHLVPETGAPQIGDRPEWDRRIAERGLDGVVLSAINGRGAMQAFGGQYTAAELTAATLVMAGRVDGTDPSDVDFDGVADDLDNCPRVPNPGQRDTDGDGIGDLCEAGVVLDADEDGYPATLDNDDADARRLPAQVGVSGGGRAGLLESESRLTLGRVARAAFEERGRGGAVLEESAFDTYALRVHGSEPQADTTVVGRGEVHDVVAREAPGGAATLRVTLASNLPVDPVLQTYRPDESRWTTFVASGADALASAAVIGGGCPVSAASDNYGEGLFTGLGCLRVSIADGGPFDADGRADGQVAFTFRVASERTGTTRPEDLGGGGGGGGATGALTLAAGAGWWLGRGFLRRRRRRDALLRDVPAVADRAPLVQLDTAGSVVTAPKASRAPSRASEVHAAVALLFLLLVSCRAEAFGLTALDLRFVGDSNPAKAEFEDDIEASSSVAARLSANLFGGTLADTTQVARGYSFDVSAGYGHDIDIEGLGESVYRLSGGFFHESKTRALAPFYRVGVGLSWIDSETDIRDGPAVDVSASLNLQVTPFFDTTIGAGFESRQAETDVFDTSKARVFVTANFSPAPRLVLRSGVRVIVGDEVSTATPTLGIVNGAQAIEPDPAFGGVEENRFAYLIDATSLILEAGLGYEVTPLIETNLLFRQVTTDAEGDIGYDRSLLEATLSFSF